MKSIMPLYILDLFGQRAVIILTAGGDCRHPATKILEMRYIDSFESRNTVIEKVH